MEAYVEGVPNQIVDWGAAEFCEIILGSLKVLFRTSVAV
jgi:hypothetical protein